MKAPTVASSLLNCSMTNGIAGATMDEANGVSKVTMEMTAMLPHFFPLVQFIALAGSSAESQSTMLGSAEPRTDVVVCWRFSSSSSTGSTVGIPCSEERSLWIGEGFSLSECSREADLMDDADWVDDAGSRSEGVPFSSSPTKARGGVVAMAVWKSPLGISMMVSLQWSNKSVLSCNVVKGR
jgi:hypothetical protein